MPVFMHGGEDFVNDVYQRELLSMGWLRPNSDAECELIASSFIDAAPGLLLCSVTLAAHMPAMLNGKGERLSGPRTEYRNVTVVCTTDLVKVQHVMSGITHTEYRNA